MTDLDERLQAQMEVDAQETTDARHASGYRPHTAAEYMPAVAALPPVPAAMVLRALATEMDHGAPPLYSITFTNASEVSAQLNDATPANLVAWGRIFGVTSVKVEHTAGPRDCYCVSSLFFGYSVEVWGAWRDPAIDESVVSYVPLATLDRAFDAPPALCQLCGRPIHDEPCERPS